MWTVNLVTPASIPHYGSEAVFATAATSVGTEPDGILPEEAGCSIRSAKLPQKTDLYSRQKHLAATTKLNAILSVRPGKHPSRRQEIQTCKRPALVRDGPDGVVVCVAATPHCVRFLQRNPRAWVVCAGGQ